MCKCTLFGMPCAHVYIQATRLCNFFSCHSLPFFPTPLPSLPFHPKQVDSGEIQQTDVNMVRVFFTSKKIWAMFDFYIFVSLHGPQNILVSPNSGRRKGGGRDYIVRATIFQAGRKGGGWDDGRGRGKGRKKRGGGKKLGGEKFVAAATGGVWVWRHSPPHFPPHKKKKNLVHFNV